MCLKSINKILILYIFALHQKPENYNIYVYLGFIICFSFRTGIGLVDCSIRNDYLSEFIPSSSKSNCQHVRTVPSFSERSRSGIKE